MNLENLFDKILVKIKASPEWAANRIQEGEKAIEENKELRDMLIKTHTGLGRMVYFQGNDDFPTCQDWKALPDKLKEYYCLRASSTAGIDHSRYLEILKEAE